MGTKRFFKHKSKLNELHDTGAMRMLIPTTSSYDKVERFLIQFDPSKGKDNYNVNKRSTRTTRKYVASEVRASNPIFKHLSSEQLYHVWRALT